MNWQMAVLTLIVLLMVWRVWRLEKASGHFITRKEWAEGRCLDWEQASRNRREGLNALARALGYEWKRTDAKEGWERTYAHVKMDNIPISNNPAVVYHYYAKPKPDTTYTANTQGADGKVRKVSSKKPRRAH